MRSFSFGKDAIRLKLLQTCPAKWDLEMLPIARRMLIPRFKLFRKRWIKPNFSGEVLFMDQRQLLTFGYITDVPLVPDYEKKVMMNEALSGNVSLL